MYEHTSMLICSPGLLCLVYVSGFVFIVFEETKTLLDVNM